MNAVTALADHPFAQALAWALLHFLWQGAMLGLAAMACFRVFSRSANARYVAGVATLAAMLAAPVVTTIWIASARTAAPATASVSEAPPIRLNAPIPSVSTADTAAPAATGAAQPLTGIVLAIWMIGVTAFSIRLLGGWLTARRVARRALRPAAPEIQAMAKRLAGRLALQRIVEVVESAGVAVPIMVGWLKPVILLPTSVISGFTPEQVEALIVHELAHIRRNDYLVNLLQAAVETVLFYHPAVWWVSRRIRSEREHCCDDLAVTICDRLVYARALSDLAAMTTPAVAMAATSGSLVDRVRRILGRSTAESEIGAGWLPVFLILAVLAPALPATLKSADQTVTPVQTGQTVPVRVEPPVPPPTEPQVVVPVEAIVPPVRQGTTTASNPVKPQTADPQAAELLRVEEALKRLAEQQRETMNKQFDLAIAANESQMRAQLNELALKLKALQAEYERAKRMTDAGVVSGDELAQIRQQMEHGQHEMEQAKAKGDLERSRLLLERTEADQKREYDRLIQEYAKLRGYPAETEVSATAGAPEPVTDPSAVALIGDLVEVTVSGEPGLQNPVVEKDGTIRLPFIGTIPVKGLTTTQIGEAVAKRLTDRKLATNPKVSVTLLRQ